MSKFRKKSRFIKKKKDIIGTPPGTLDYTGEEKLEPVKITIMEYNEKELQEEEFKPIEGVLRKEDKNKTIWINLDGLYQAKIVERIGEEFNIHPLILEDIVNVDQRPKIEIAENYVCLIFKVLEFDENRIELKVKQVSIVISANYVLSFLERKSDVFNPVIERIRKSLGRIRKQTPDYLAYSLLDVVVDHYFVLLEIIGEKMENLEDELVTNPTNETLQSIYNLKNNLLIFRKVIWPLREAINRILRRETPLIRTSTEIFFRDVYDHVIQIIDMIETYREMLSGMLDIYLSSISNRMNEVMKVLTIIATIFIPLTFIVGLYGMNFQFMPELYWEWGYPLVLILMAIISIIMIIHFKKKKWL